MKRRTEITVETERLLVLSAARSAPAARCGVCGAGVEMIGACEAAALAGVSERTVHRLVDAGLLHFAETRSGRLLVCPRSLGRALNPQAPD
jgi:hypothetical protein